MTSCELKKIVEGLRLGLQKNIFRYRYRASCANHSRFVRSGRQDGGTRNEERGTLFTVPIAFQNSARFARGP